MIIESQEFTLIMQKNIKDTINLLIKNGQEFSIVAKSKYVVMIPNLPNILKQYPDLIRFDLVKYSFETSLTNDNDLIFRAGFGAGKNAIETEIKIPLYRISQIIINNSPILINFANPQTIKKDRSKLFISKNRELFKK
jgi:hypothetical protein